jgi:hypothetical protein
VASGVRVNPIDSADDITRVATDYCFLMQRTPCDGRYLGNDREEVLAWATGRVGRKYGYLNAFMCGLRNVIPGLQIKQGNEVICSELVAEALERAGHDFEKDSALVSPGDLADHFGVPRR